MWQENTLLPSLMLISRPWIGECTEKLHEIWVFLSFLFWKNFFICIRNDKIRQNLDHWETEDGGSGDDLWRKEGKSDLTWKLGTSEHEEQQPRRWWPRPQRPSLTYSHWPRKKNAPAAAGFDEYEANNFKCSACAIVLSAIKNVPEGYRYRARVFDYG